MMKALRVDTEEQRNCIILRGQIYRNVQFLNVLDDRRRADGLKRALCGFLHMQISLLVMRNTTQLVKTVGGRFCLCYKLWL